MLVYRCGDVATGCNMVGGVGVGTGVGDRGSRRMCFCKSEVCVSRGMRRRPQPVSDVVLGCQQGRHSVSRVLSARPHRAHLHRRGQEPDERKSLNAIISILTYQTTNYP